MAQFGLACMKRFMQAIFLIQLSAILWPCNSQSHKAPCASAGEGVGDVVAGHDDGSADGLSGPGARRG
jgi:hypothetical protein